MTKILVSPHTYCLTVIIYFRDILLLMLDTLLDVIGSTYWLIEVCVKGTRKFSKLNIDRHNALLTSISVTCLLHNCACVCIQFARCA